VYCPVPRASAGRGFIVGSRANSPSDANPSSLLFAGELHERAQASAALRCGTTPTRPLPLRGGPPNLTRARRRAALEAQPLAGAVVAGPQERPTRERLTQEGLQRDADPPQAQKLELAYKRAHG